MAGIIHATDGRSSKSVLNAQKDARALPKMTTIGKRIERLRDARGLTQTQLGRAAKIGQNTISRYEAGLSDPSREAVARLATALGVHPAAIEFGALTDQPLGPMGPVLSSFLTTIEGQTATAEEVSKLRAADATLSLETPLACHYALQAIRQTRH